MVKKRWQGIPGRSLISGKAGNFMNLRICSITAVDGFRLIGEFRTLAQQQLRVSVARLASTFVVMSYICATAPAVSQSTQAETPPAMPSSAGQASSTEVQPTVQAEKKPDNSHPLFLWKASSLSPHARRFQRMLRVSQCCEY